VATSIGAGISAGIQQGAGIARQFQDDAARQEEREERKLDRETQRADRDRLRQRQEKLEAQSQEDREYKLVDEERTKLGQQAEGLVRQYGGYDKVPKEEMDRVNNARREVSSRLETVQRKRLAPVLERENAETRQNVNDLKSGKLNIEDMTDGGFRRFVGTLYKGDPDDLLPDANGVNQLGNALQAIQSAPMGSEEQAAAANVILKNELTKGVGSLGRDGFPIVKKEIIKLVPGPDGKRMLPVLRVTTQRPDGATGGYTAPVTEGRSSSADDDNVVQVDVGDALNYAGALSTLVELARTPGFAEKLQRGKSSKTDAERLERFREAYAWASAKPVQRKIKAEHIQRDNVVTRIISDQDTGEEIKREDLPKGIDPTRAAVAEIGSESRERTAGIRAAAPGAAGRPPPADKPLSEQQVAQRVKNAKQAKADEFKFQWSADRKTWLTSDGKKAPQDKIEEINEAGVRASREADRLTAAGKANAPKVDDATKQRLNAMREKAGLPPL
jgi:hypothetical protein